MPKPPTGARDQFLLRGELRRPDHLESVSTRRPDGSLPAEAVHASLGCGNPTALIALSPGQTVLDLGSGGGIDVLLSANARRARPARCTVST